MHTKDIIERIAGIMRELTILYNELSQELPENYLRVVVDNTRAFSELKKMPRNPRSYRFRPRIPRHAPQTAQSPPLRLRKLKQHIILRVSRKKICQN